MLSTREPVYQALWAGPCDFDEVLISPVMIQDHMPDNMLRALNKVSQDAIVLLRRQQVKRSQTPLSRTPSMKPGHYEPLEETIDGLDISNEVIQRDQIAETTPNQIADRGRVQSGIGCTSIIVDVEVHECKKTKSHWQSGVCSLCSFKLHEQRVSRKCDFHFGKLASPVNQAQTTDSFHDHCTRIIECYIEYRLRAT